MVREEMFRLEHLANLMAEVNVLLAIVVASTNTARESHDS